MTSTYYNPTSRLRRLRTSPSMRNLLCETHITVDDLILPLFVDEGISERQEIASMPGVFRESEKSLPEFLKKSQKNGINNFIIFGVSHKKDDEGSDSMKKDGLLYRMLSSAKDTLPDSNIIADVCFCEYTDHGHCGPIAPNGDVDNDATIENIAKQALIAAEAGADIIAPSGMMDGQVGAIRTALDENNFENIPIMAYSAKFASTYYGPFRDAAGCALGKYDHVAKDRKTYQMNPANALEAMREVEQDIIEGADMVMVKPGLAYLDILYRVKETFQTPTFAYNVSGEYAMLKAAHANGWLDYETTMMETLLSFKRAGADGILTYSANDAAKILNEA